jgi:23S rRNA pseudouridine955/2504/2580 synthase/23S rRNA pseudouridine1911/1915/1917 synthase
MRRRIQFVIPEERAGVAALAFLVARFTYHTESEWLEQIGAGRVTVNGRRAAPEQLLAAGDELAYDTDGIPEPPWDDRIRIVHRDDDLIVVDKSGNLTCHPGGRYFNHTLWALLKTRHGIDDPTFINRIDRETSGLVVVSRTPQATKKLRAQFAGRTVAKRYLALVEGGFPAAASSAGWIAPDFSGEVLKKRRFIPVPGATAAEAAGSGHGGREGVAPPPDSLPPHPDAQWAYTRFRLVSRHGPVSLVEAQPHTGRLHQIRVTLLALGFPLVGDKMYGVDPGVFLRFCKDACTAEDHLRMRMRRQALHAAGLRFRHPRTNQLLAFDLPLPQDMQDCLDALGASGG